MNNLFQVAFASSAVALLCFVPAVSAEEPSYEVEKVVVDTGVAAAAGAILGQGLAAGAIIFFSPRQIGDAMYIPPAPNLSIPNMQLKSFGSFGGGGGVIGGLLDNLQFEVN